MHDHAFFFFFFFLSNFILRDKRGKTTNRRFRSLLDNKRVGRVNGITYPHHFPTNHTLYTYIRAASSQSILIFFFFLHLVSFYW